MGNLPDDWINATWNYVQEADDRERAAAARHAALLKVHEAGWRAVADAVKTGLAAIAYAVRSGSSGR
jgi:hypothetical protein